MSDSMIRGACLCGRVRFEAEPPAKFVAHCHCHNCRRAHGAAFVTWIGFPAERFRITAGQEDLVRYRTDTEATRSFCGSCGSTLLYESPRWEDEVHAVVANLLESPEQPPSGHVYADRAPEWCPILDDLPRYGGETGVEPIDG